VIVAALAPRLTMPVVVVELILGIALGPQGAELADVDSFTNFVGNLGLGMLFFVAGYEIDFERIRGRPLELGLLAWALSLVLAGPWHSCSIVASSPGATAWRSRSTRRPSYRS
jgi:Kef-type K+ transport system membrane component KefB